MAYHGWPGGAENFVIQTLRIIGNGLQFHENWNIFLFQGALIFELF